MRIWMLLRPFWGHIVDLMEQSIRSSQDIRQARVFRSTILPRVKHATIGSDSATDPTPRMAMRKSVTESHTELHINPRISLGVGKYAVLGRVAL